MWDLALHSTEDRSCPWLPAKQTTDLVLASTFLIIKKYARLSRLSAMDILLQAMLPDELPEGQTLVVRTEGRKGDQRRPKSSECVHEAELGGHITNIIVKVFDVCFALVGIGGPFGGTSKIAGRSVVNKIIRGAGGK